MGTNSKRRQTTLKKHPRYEVYECLEFASKPPSTNWAIIDMHERTLIKTNGQIEKYPKQWAENRAAQLNSADLMGHNLQRKD